MPISRKTIFYQLLTFSCLFTTQGFAAVIFSDNFDSHPDWSPKQGTECYDNNRSCREYPPPSGYDGYRVQETVYSIPGHATLNIDAQNYRGTGGKALTYYSESNLNGSSWSSDGLLNIKLPNTDGYPELYLRLWIKFQKGWVWSANNSALQKFNKISHFDGGNPFLFFAEGNHHPSFFSQLGKWNGGKSDIAYIPGYRFETTYFPSHGDPTIYLGNPDGRIPGYNGYDGIGKDFAAPGMLGDGNWHCWEYYVRANSAVGAADGVHRFWIDGVELVDTKKNFPDKDLDWSDPGSRANPRKYWNYVQIGGNNDNQFAAAAKGLKQWYALDDLVVSTHYSGPPPKPVNVAAKVLKGSTVRLSWDAGANGATYLLDGYRILFGTDPANLDNKVDVGKATSHEVQGLSEGKSYYFTVVAYNKASYDRNENDSLRSDVVYIKVNKYISSFSWYVKFIENISHYMKAFGIKS